MPVLGRKNDTNSATHEENGWYEVALNSTDTNTLGELIVAVNETGALPVWREFQVVPANIYDSLVAGSDTLTTDVTQWNGTNVGTPASAGYPVVTLKDDLYHADIQFTRDQSNTQDEYTITWFKNGVRQTTGITSPTIQVIKRSDGSDLIASTTPTQIASTGTYKHDATGANRQTVGEAVLVVVTATIDAGSRSFSRLIGRDSS